VYRLQFGAVSPIMRTHCSHCGKFVSGMVLLELCEWLLKLPPTRAFEPHAIRDVLW